MNIEKEEKAKTAFMDALSNLVEDSSDFRYLQKLANAAIAEGFNEGYDAACHAVVSEGL